MWNKKNPTTTLLLRVLLIIIIRKHNLGIRRKYNQCEPSFPFWYILMYFWCNLCVSSKQWLHLRIYRNTAISGCVQFPTMSVLASFLCEYLWHLEASLHHDKSWRSSQSLSHFSQCLVKYSKMVHCHHLNLAVLIEAVLMVRWRYPSKRASPFQVTSIWIQRFQTVLWSWANKTWQLMVRLQVQALDMHTHTHIHQMAKSIIMSTAVFWVGN